MSDFKIVKLVDPIVVQTNGVNISPLGNTAGTTANVSSGTLFLAGGNNVTLSQSGNTISINGGAGGGGGGVTPALSGSNGSFSYSTATFGNLNGLSFYTSNGSMVGSYTVPTVPAQTEYIFSNSNGVTFGTNGSTVTASHNGLTSQSNQALSGSNGSFTFQTATFGNLNGLSFYTSNGSLVASYTVPTQSVQTQNMVSVQGSTGNISFANGNGVTFGGNASTITASHNGITQQSTQPVAASASNGSFNFSTLKFVETNGVTFATSTDGIRASVETNYQAPGAYLTTARASNDAIGLNTAVSNATITANSSGLSIDGRGYAGTNTTFNGANISGSITQNSNGLNLSLSVAPGGGGADGYNILAAGTQTAATTGTVQLVDSNGISFGMSNSSQITASYTVPSTAGLISAINVSGGTTSNNLSKITFADGNGVSFGLNGSTLTATVKTDYQSSNANYLTSQSNQAFSAQGGSSTFQTLSFTNSNGFSFSNTNGSIWGSYTVPTVTNSSLTMQAGASTLSSVSRIAFGDGNGVSFGASTSNNGSITITASHNGLTSQSNQAFSASGGSSAFQTLNFANSNGITFSNSNGSVIASHNGLTQQSTQPVAVSGQNGSYAFSTLSLSNANGVSFGTSAGSAITASYTVPTVTQYFSNTATTFNGTNVSGSITLNTNGIRVDLSAGAGGGVTPVASASNGSFSFTTLNFSNANNVTFGTSAGSIVTASVAPPGAAAENNWFALTGANTTGNTTASGSTIGLSGINITLSGTNGSGINISAPATSSLSATGQLSISTNGSTISIGVPNQVTLSGFHPYGDLEMVTMATSQGTLSVEPMVVPNVQFDRVLFPINNTNSSNSSGSHTLNFRVGIYTQNGSTLSLLASASQSTALTHSGTAGSYSLYSGMRLFSIGMTTTLTEGRYWLAFNSNTTSGGANGSYSLFGLSNQASNFLGMFGSSHNTTYQFTLGQGIYTASTTAIPSSIGFSQIRGSDSVAFRSPYIGFASSTV